MGGFPFVAESQTRFLEAGAPCRHAEAHGARHTQYGERLDRDALGSARTAARDQHRVRVVARRDRAGLGNDRARRDRRGDRRRQRNAAEPARLRKPRARRRALAQSRPDARVAAVRRRSRRFRDGRRRRRFSSLERVERAQARGARVLARIRGYGSRRRRLSHYLARSFGEVRSDRHARRARTRRRRRRGIVTSSTRMRRARSSATPRSRGPSMPSMPANAPSSRPSRATSVTAWRAPARCARSPGIAGMHDVADSADDGNGAARSRRRASISSWRGRARIPIRHFKSTPSASADRMRRWWCRDDEGALAAARNVRSQVSARGATPMNLLVKGTSGPLTGEVEVPNSKYHAHRALIFASLAPGTSRIRGLSDARHVHYTMDVLRALGTKIEVDGETTARYRRSVPREAQDRFGRQFRLDALLHDRSRIARGCADHADRTEILPAAPGRTAARGARANGRALRIGGRLSADRDRAGKRPRGGNDRHSRARSRSGSPGCCCSRRLRANGPSSRSRASSTSGRTSR